MAAVDSQEEPCDISHSPSRHVRHTIPVWDGQSLVSVDRSSAPAPGVSACPAAIRPYGAVLLYTESEDLMTYVITQPCVGVKDGSCVDVCPVDCIHPAAGEPDYDQYDQLYINPDECIDCGACEPACPVTAIFEESAVPEEWKEYTQLNADYFRKAAQTR
jgi:NAD-dependent dihydropyrimidine dehydrogenase PreA subunit